MWIFLSVRPCVSIWGHTYEASSVQHPLCLDFDIINKETKVFFSSPIYTIVYRYPNIKGIKVETHVCLIKYVTESVEKENITGNVTGKYYRESLQNDSAIEDTLLKNYAPSKLILNYVLMYN